MQGRLSRSYFGGCDVGGLNAVLDEKLRSRIGESGGLNEVSNRAGKSAENFAEVELHLAGLRFEVSPIRPDHHWLNDSVKILQPPRLPSGLVAENEPL